MKHNIYGYDIDRVHKVLEHLEQFDYLPRKAGYTTTMLYILLGALDVANKPLTIAYICPTFSRAMWLRSEALKFFKRHNVQVWNSPQDNQLRVPYLDRWHTIKFVTMTTVQEELAGTQPHVILDDLNDVPNETLPSNYSQYIKTLQQATMEEDMLVNDDKNQTKWWVKTSQGKFGPYGSKQLAEGASLTVPRNVGEIPEILERTTDDKQILLG